MKLIWVSLEHLGEHDSDVRLILLYELPLIVAIVEWIAGLEAFLFGYVPCVLASPCFLKRCRDGGNMAVARSPTGARPGGEGTTGIDAETGLGGVLEKEETKSLVYTGV